ncbi:MAG: hypothetical protein ACOCTP_02675 [Roseicyclus sp.]
MNEQDAELLPSLPARGPGFLHIVVQIPCLKEEATIAGVIADIRAATAACIPDHVAPILEDRADLVVGCRPIRDIAHFSPVKKRLQLLRSALVRGPSRTSVRDATSGFRALNRETALATHTFGDYTYTL